MKIIYEHVKEHCKNDTTGHDWWHIYRVVNLALFIGEKEGANIQLLELAALLHDLDDWKISSNNDNYVNARRAMDLIGADRSTIDQVIAIISQVSFKGAGVDTTPTSIEAKVVQDADRLDAIGAIGIARTFAYGGSKQNPIHDPDLAPVFHSDFDHYKSSRGTTINHFYEKLLLLKDLLNTESAKGIAMNRHRFMEQFLKQFFTEWELKDS